MNEYPITGSPPNRDGSACLNARHNGAGCIRCMTACPTLAISLDRGIPMINEPACVACGACVQACPTGAFEPSGRPLEAALLMALTDRPRGTLGVACVQAPEATTLPVDVLGRSERCLSALSVSNLLDLAHQEEDVWIDDSHCPSCEIGATRTGIHQTVAATNALLASTDVTVRIRLGTSPHESRGGTPEMIDGTAMSRRALFSAVKRRASEITTPGVEIDGLDADVRLPRRLPKSRKSLLGAIGGLDPVRWVKTEKLPMTDVKVDTAACSACSLCARFCPSDALEFLANTDLFSLVFRPSTCLDCGICATACPDDAISYHSELPPQALSATTRWKLAEGTLVACSQCGVQTASHGQESPICSFCRDSVGQVRPLRDEAGLMDDLLRRSDT
ncbi:MAG: hypothetical protein GWP04_07710 [Gammaproteobacteria bacterium]|nr:hypothetical protein [Gammaproteobacteria bacterium]